MDSDAGADSGKIDLGVYRSRKRGIAP